MVDERSNSFSASIGLKQCEGEQDRYVLLDPATGEPLPASVFGEAPLTNLLTVKESQLSKAQFALDLITGLGIPASSFSTAVLTYAADVLNELAIFIAGTYQADHKKWTADVTVRQGDRDIETTLTLEHFKRLTKEGTLEKLANDIVVVPSYEAASGETVDGDLYVLILNDGVIVAGARMPANNVKR